MAFSPDSRWLASGSADRTVRLQFTLKVLTEIGCQKVRRNLSWAEWQRYLGQEAYRRTCPALPIHPSFIESGRELARAGQVEEAIARFEAAVALDPTLDLDPEEEANQFALLGLIAQTANLFSQGDVETAVVTLKQAHELAPDFQQLSPDIAAELNDSSVWNTLCWQGRLWNHAAEVIDACEVAVQLAPEDGGIRDSRGMARALTGDFAGAIADFQAFVAWAPDHDHSDEVVDRRHSWIEVLNNGGNPFDEDMLETLRNES